MADIHVMGGFAPEEAFKRLTPAFERQSGHRTVYHFAVLKEVRERLESGERPDVIVMPVVQIDGYVKEGLAREDARGTLGVVRTAVAVKEGGPAPDLSSAEAFRQALLKARAIAHAPGNATPSGIYLTSMMQKLGIAEAMAKKTIYKTANGGGVAAVRSGEADFGIYPRSEILLPGIRVAGLLPPGIEFNNVYGAAAVKGKAAADAAAAFVRFMCDPANKAAWSEAGFDPA